MQRGTLETIVGAMFAGKTSELLKRILWFEHQGKKIVVFKPLIDNRYSVDKISTHNKNEIDCILFYLLNKSGLFVITTIKCLN